MTQNRGQTRCWSGEEKLFALFWRYLSPLNYIVRFQAHIMEDKEKIPLLKDEHLLIQKTYKDFDVRLMTMKDWSAIAIAHVQNPKGN